jgi:hypothetical protein
MRREKDMKRLTLVAVGMSLAGIAVNAQSAPSSQFPQLSPAEQRTVDAQLAPPTLDPKATVINVTYHSSLANLRAPATVTVDTKSTAGDALKSALAPNRLAYVVTGSKSVFAFPDTQDNRQKFTDFSRTFTITKADVGAVGVAINRSLSPMPADELRPTIVTISSVRVIFVRATPGMMERIAKVVAENDK